MSDPFESAHMKPMGSMGSTHGTPLYATSPSKVPALSPARYPKVPGGAPSPPSPLPAVRYPPTTAANPADSKLREVVCALNEVAMARKNEAQALQQQLEQLSAEYRKVCSENEQLQSQMSQAMGAAQDSARQAGDATQLQETTHALDQAQQEMSALNCRNQDLEQRCQTLQMELDFARSAPAPAAAQPTPASAAASVPGASAPPSRVASAVPQSMPSEPVQMKSAGTARSFDHPHPSLVQQESAPGIPTPHASVVSKATTVPSPPAPTPAPPAPARNAVRPPFDLTRLAGVAGVLLFNLLLMYVALPADDGAADVVQRIALAGAGSPSESIALEAVREDALYDAVAELITTTLDGGALTLLGELIESGHAVTPPKAWRAVAAVCKGIDAAFPDPERTREAADVLVSAVCWDCSEAPSSGFSLMSVVLTLVALQLGALAVVAFLRQSSIASLLQEIRNPANDAPDFQAAVPTVMFPAGKAVVENVWVDSVRSEGVDQELEVTVEFRRVCEEKPQVGLASGLLGHSLDVHSFRLFFSAGVLQGVRFLESYGGTQAWDAQGPAAQTHELPATAFKPAGSSVAVWVNTPNHLLSETPSNPGLEYIAYGQPALRGSRAKVLSAAKGLLSQ